MPKARFICGDSIHLPLPDNSIDTICCDPPYGILFMQAGWDHEVPGIPYWVEALRVAKPGAMLLAFGGTRKFHRLACAIEDAGWILRDVISWNYGSGFPKSLDISKALDKAAGAERAVVGANPNHRAVSGVNYEGVYAGGNTGAATITAPATEEAKRWCGWGSALKPSWEPIIVAMKPLDGTYAENALKHGVAGFNIDGARIEQRQDQFESEACSGRWPANTILECTCGAVQPQGNPACPRCGGTGIATFDALWEEWRDAMLANDPDEDVEELRIDWKRSYGLPVPCFTCVTHAVEMAQATGHTDPNCPAAQLDVQSGVTTSGAMKRDVPGYDGESNTGFVRGRSGPSNQHGDSGGASRFFYCAKASKRERTCHGTVENKHPTLKPLALMRYLVRLTNTPTGGVVLDPFMGSGTTGMACVLEQRGFIGCDIEQEHVSVSVQRVRHAAEHPEMYAPEFVASKQAKPKGPGLWGASRQT